MILIRGGQVLTPEGMVAADVLVDGGRIAAIGPGLEAPDAVVVEAAGCWVGPGLVDLHVHLREPGEEWKEDIASGTGAAAAGGFTAVVAMPNTDPPVDAGHRAAFVAEQGRVSGLCLVLPSGTVTLGRAGTELAHLDEMWDVGVRMFTDDGDTIADAGVMRRAMEYLADRDCVIAQHAEEPGLAAGGHLHEGEVSSRLGISGLPALAEETVVARDLELVRLTAASYHVQHVSTAGTVALIRQAKAAGLPVTAEVTPHHLLLDHGAVESMDPSFKMYPPLRTVADVAELRDALRDGTIDAVATDHAPHADHEKDVPFEEAPRGVIGLETAIGAVLAATEMDPAVFFERMSIAPALIARASDHGRPLEIGGQANLVVIDPGIEWTPGSFRSRSENSPFRHQILRGQAIATVFDGRITHQAARVS